MTRFVLLTHGTRGDVDPFAATASGLVRRGHRVSVLTHAPYESVVRSTGAAAGEARRLLRRDRFRSAH